MAPIGNIYAEKWTYQRTLDRLYIIEQHSRNEDCLYLGDALDITGLYDDVWRYWQRKWRKCHEIIQQMKQIMQHFEVKLFRKMVKKEIPERVAMFALRHHYRWDKEPLLNLGTLPDYSYVDQEIILEQAEIKPDTTPTTEPTHATTPATLLSPPKTHPAPTLDEDTMFIMRWQYNQNNPNDQITTPLPYFYGDPPAGFDTIKFDVGYFLRG